MTCVTIDASERAQAAYLISSEAVAKFSSFRQLRVSTFNDLLAVTRVTSLSDAHQQLFASQSALRVVFHIKGMRQIASSPAIRRNFFIQRHLSLELAHVRWSVALFPVAICIVRQCCGSSQSRAGQNPIDT